MSKFVREMAKISIVDNLSINPFNEDDCQIIGSVDLRVELLS